MKKPEKMSKNDLILEVESLRKKLREFESVSFVPKEKSIAGAPEVFPGIDIQHLVEGIWVIDKEGTTTWANQPMASMLGYTQEEMIGRHLFDFMTQEERSVCQKKLKARQNGVKEIHDFTFQSKSGAPVYTRISASPLMDDNQEYAGAIASVVNISDLTRLQNQLSANFQNAPIGMVHLDLDGMILRANTVFCEAMGYAETELRGKSFLEITHPDDKTACRIYKDEAVRDIAQPKLSKRHITRDGKTLWIDLSLSLVKDENDKPFYLIGTTEDVTEHHEMVDNLNRLTRLLNEAQELGAIGGWEFDVATQKSYWTSNLYQLFGYSPEEIHDEHSFFQEKIVHPDDKDHISKTFNKIFVDKKPVHTIFRCVRKDKQIRTIAGAAIPHLDTDGSILRISGANQDITGQKEAEKQLKNSERRLRYHFEMDLVGMVVVGWEKDWLLVNDKFKEIVGYNQDELESMKWPDFTHPDDIEENTRLFERVIDGEIDDYSLEKRYIHKDGHIVYASIYSKCIRNDDGSPEYLITHVMDVTERVKAEQEANWNLKINMALARLYPPLVASHATLKYSSEAILKEALAMTDSEHGYAAVIDEQGAAIQAFSDMMGQCSAPEGHDSVTFPQDANGKYPSLWGYSLNTKHAFYTNTPQDEPASRGVPKGHIPLECFLSVPILLGRKLVGQLAVSNKPGGYDDRDLDALMRLGAYYALAIQRAESQKELTSSKELMEKILDGIHAGIMVIDPKTKRIESINTVALDMLQATEAQVLGQKCDIFCWQKADGTDVVGCPAKVSRIHDWELRMHRMDKSILPISKTVIEEFVDGEKKYIEIFFDITNRKELERQLSLAQKLESIGQLSAGIAHEINTPAQYLGDNLKFFSQSFIDILNFANLYHECDIQRTNGIETTEDCIDLEQIWKDIDMDYLIEEIPSALAQSRDGINRITSIVQAMKRFSHPGIDHKQHADINDALENTVTVCRNEWKYHSNIVFELDQNLPLVPVFINDLNQAFLNIIVNAAHAIASKIGENDRQGTITIRTRQEDDWVVVEIEDTGQGIQKAIMPKIFDPFFTTKEVGSGTGQGLALCHSTIVEKHGGTIDFKSEPDVGTRCIIKLPIGGGDILNGT